MIKAYFLDSIGVARKIYVCDPAGVNIINSAYFGYKRVTATRSEKSINIFGLWG